MRSAVSYIDRFRAYYLNYAHAAHRIKDYPLVMKITTEKMGKLANDIAALHLKIAKYNELLGNSRFKDLIYSRLLKYWNNQLIKKSEAYIKYDDLWHDANLQLQTLEYYPDDIESPFPESPNLARHHDDTEDDDRNVNAEAIADLSAKLEESAHQRFNPILFNSLAMPSHSRGDDTVGAHSLMYNNDDLKYYPNNIIAPLSHAELALRTNSVLSFQAELQAAKLEPRPDIPNVIGVKTTHGNRLLSNAYSSSIWYLLNNRDIADVTTQADTVAAQHNIASRRGNFQGILPSIICVDRRDNRGLVAFSLRYGNKILPHASHTENNMLDDFVKLPGIGPMITQVLSRFNLQAVDIFSYNNLIYLKVAPTNIDSSANSDLRNLDLAIANEQTFISPFSYRRTAYNFHASFPIYKQVLAKQVNAGTITPLDMRLVSHTSRSPIGMPVDEHGRVYYSTRYDRYNEHLHIDVPEINDDIIGMSTVYQGNNFINAFSSSTWFLTQAIADTAVNDTSAQTRANITLAQYLMAGQLSHLTGNLPSTICLTNPTRPELRNFIQQNADAAIGDINKNQYLDKFFSLDDTGKEIKLLLNACKLQAVDLVVKHNAVYLIVCPKDRV